VSAGITSFCEAPPSLVGAAWPLLLADGPVNFLTNAGLKFCSSERYARGDPTALARDIIAELDRAGFVIVPRQPDKERPNGNHAD
jgi:hypothetical protein